MNIRKKLLDKITKKEIEIQELKSKISESKAYIQALNDTLRLLPKDRKDVASSADKLRPGSVVFKTWNFLKKADKPVHINDILIAIGKELTKRDKTALAGSLGWYVRRHEIFTRPAPNTFGLIDIGNDEEPPHNFGLNEETDLQEKTKLEATYNEETTDLESF